MCYHSFDPFFAFLSPQEQFPKYWPAFPGETSTYGKLTVKLASEKQEMYCTVRKMELAMDSNYVNMGTPTVIEC